MSEPPQQLLTRRDAGLVQQIIYFFNELENRSYLLDKLFLKSLYPEKPIAYLGTYNVRAHGKRDLVDDDAALKSPVSAPLTLDVMLARDERRCACGDKTLLLWTVCLHYEDMRVHFVSFVYNRDNHKLYSFDSGSNLYCVGEDIIVPRTRDAVEKAFGKAKISRPGKTTTTKHGGQKKPCIDHEHVGRCDNKHYGTRWGIQFSGDNPLYNHLPADAFCQSWSLFFLCEIIRRYRPEKPIDMKFIRLWCNIEPRHREWYIISAFFLPLLAYNPVFHSRFSVFYPHGHVCDLRLHMLEDKWSRLAPMTPIQKQHQKQRQRAQLP